MILLIDNYDSFTYNLYQQIGAFYKEIQVVRNNKITIEEIKRLNPTGIVLSPGPGRPEDAGICIDIIKNFYQHVPILGICLGHQLIAYAFGANIISAKEIMHGKVSSINHNGLGIFKSLPPTINVMRYHSLAVEHKSLPEKLNVLASTEDGEIMAIQHRDYRVIGLQFHPESIGTENGATLIQYFLSLCESQSNKKGGSNDEGIFAKASR
ncbi:anthranilate synthase component II [Peribacillus alkalitolerans]|uniref:anthranilate synthase component II n=1 Tax=Peribacillus alkalitolerans TaxID=1550385 RepID=UPI0013D0557E|nr:aminodeoxychorismate/anthranilate synthase component II [Peribacillus alkalitolerans]